MFCYNCGTELPEGSIFCSTCGQRLDLKPIEASPPPPPPPPTSPPQPSERSPFEPPYRQRAEPQYQPPPTFTPPPGYYDRETYEPFGANQYVRPERDAYGYKIPFEYPTHFDRNGWSWPAFWFPVYWYCYKGMYNASWKFILVSLIPYVGELIARIWAGIAGYKEYSEYLNRTPPNEVERNKRTGLGCMITLIVFGFVILILYIFIYIFIFSSFMASEY